MIGFVDESCHAAPPGRFVLAAVLVEHEAIEEVRSQLRTVPPARKGLFHWRDEDDPLRRKMLGITGTTCPRGVVVVATPVGRRRVERARAVCLSRLLWELYRRDARHVVIESRGDQDRADRSTIGGLRRSMWLSRKLTFEHRDKSEPLLWAADAVAGACAHDLTQGTRYNELLPGVELVAVEGLP